MHKIFQASFWILTSSRDVNNKVLSSALQVLNLLPKPVKVKSAVKCFRESVQSLYKVIMCSYMSGGSMTTYVPSCPALQLSQLHTSCSERRSNLEGIVLLPGWNIPVCAENLILSCLTLITMSLRLRCFVYRQRQTGLGDNNSHSFNYWTEVSGIWRWRGQ